MMYYVMLAAATVLFSAQFLFNQKFEEECGASMASAALFSLYTSVCALLIAAALFFSMERGKKGSCMRYYIEVFVLNGMVGVISVIHQSDTGAEQLTAFAF